MVPAQLEGQENTLTGLVSMMWNTCQQMDCLQSIAAVR